VFRNLIRLIEKGEIKALVSKTYPLEKIKQDQEEFLAKKHIVKQVLIPPLKD
jgi:NADPH:quinone reductase-like Zn-dependent oxidoreductase|tara:strand:+ start:851 stop:1006 length:156 start_codon:yes stop_codon:yes gene_type:complete